MTMDPKTHRPDTEAAPIVPKPQATRAAQTQSPTLEPSPGAAALTTRNESADAAQVQAVSYEVFLEQIAHDMAYEDQLTPTQLALLQHFGYSAEAGVDGPHGFYLRGFTPSNPEYPHPILAFRGTEFTSRKDLQTDLEPHSVGLNQFRANQRRIQEALGRLGRFGRPWVTGHSLGGALAQLTAASYSAQVGRVITFQSPGIDAGSVKRLEAFNRAHPDETVSSTHYQVEGDVVSSSGEALTPGEIVTFSLQPSGGNRAKTVTAGVLMGVLVGPGTGITTAAAMEAISKHRAFPVSNAAQEHPAFQELFEEGKTFERVAGINKDTFEPKKPISSELFQSSRISNFLRHNVGRTVFDMQRASSDWGGDARAREWVARNRERIDSFTASELLEHLQRLLEGWVSDDDVVAFETICFGVKDPKVMAAIRVAIQPRLEDLHSESQRRWIEDAINFQPKPDTAAVQRDAMGMAPAALSPLQFSGGRALEAAQRARLEAHFNANLETVRVHEDDAAAKHAADYAARAFTQGEHIVLARGVTLSDELAAHEVAHVLQQRGGQVSSGIDPDPALEAEARLAGQSFAAGAAPQEKRAPVQPRTSSQVVQRLQDNAGLTWQNRLFAANLAGTTDNRRIDFTLDRADNKITGSFAIHGTGHGLITTGSYNSKSAQNPLHLECQFTDGELSGQTRVLDGWFLYAESGQHKDENNDGKNDTTKTALPLLIGGWWKGGKKDYKLEPISPSASTPKGTGDDTALEAAILQALPVAMKLANKTIDSGAAQTSIPLILAECKRAGIHDPRTIAYILVTASWESLMGQEMYEIYPKNADPVAYFNKKYAGYNGNGNIASGDGFRFRGRGYAQLTGRELYTHATKRLKEMDFKVDGAHPDLLETPDLVATNRPLAAVVLVFGMQEGWFTRTVGFEKYSKNHTQAMMYPNGNLDFNEARWIVNGGDTKSKVPMAQASENLSAIIENVTPGSENGSLEELADLDYARLRRIDRDGFNTEETEKITVGIETGSLDNVPGYYNGSGEAITWGRHYSSDGFYYGEKWQCVEYVRRYYHNALKHDITKLGDAHTWFTAGVEDGEITFNGLTQYIYAGKDTRSENDDGFSVKPQKGDILVLQVGNYGHVAIVAEVGETNIKIAQQNVVHDGFVTDISIKRLPSGKWRVEQKIPLALLRKI